MNISLLPEELREKAETLKKDQSSESGPNFKFKLPDNNGQPITSGGPEIKKETSTQPEDPWSNIGIEKKEVIPPKLSPPPPPPPEMKIFSKQAPAPASADKFRLADFKWQLIVILAFAILAAGVYLGVYFYGRNIAARAAAQESESARLSEQSKLAGAANAKLIGFRDKLEKIKLLQSVKFNWSDLLINLENITNSGVVYDGLYADGAGSVLLIVSTATYGEAVNQILDFKKADFIESVSISSVYDEKEKIDLSDKLNRDVAAALVQSTDGARTGYQALVLIALKNAAQ